MNAANSLSNDEDVLFMEMLTKVRNGWFGKWRAFSIFVENAKKYDKWNVRTACRADIYQHIEWAARQMEELEKKL